MYAQRFSDWVSLSRDVATKTEAYLQGSVYSPHLPHNAPDSPSITDFVQVVLPSAVDNQAPTANKLRDLAKLIKVSDIKLQDILTLTFSLVFWNSCRERSLIPWLLGASHWLQGSIILGVTSNQARFPVGL